MQELFTLQAWAVKCHSVQISGPKCCLAGELTSPCTASLPQWKNPSTLLPFFYSTLYVVGRRRACLSCCLSVKCLVPGNVETEGPLRENQQTHEGDERVVSPQDCNEHRAHDQLRNSPIGKHEDDEVGCPSLKLYHKLLD